MFEPKTETTELSTSVITAGHRELAHGLVNRLKGMLDQSPELTGYTAETGQWCPYETATMKVGKRQIEITIRHRP